MSDTISTLRNELPPGRYRTFEEIEASIHDFERVLGSVGVAIQPGSRLEAACLSGIYILMAKVNHTALPPLLDIRPSFVDACGLWQFAERINRLNGTSLLSDLLPHLRLLMEGDFAQNRKSNRHDAASNKLFELLIGLAAADIGVGTELDDPNMPTNPPGQNPDVLTTIHVAGPTIRIPDSKRWAFACKTMHSESPKTLYDRIEEAIDQIESAITAETGAVIINLKNLIDHNAYFPILNQSDYSAGAEPVFGAFTNVQMAGTLLREHAERAFVSMVNHISEQSVIDTFRGKKAIPAVIFVSQTTAGAATSIGPIPSLLTVMRLCPLVGVRRLTANEQFVMHRLNNSLQDTFAIGAS